MRDWLETAPDLTESGPAYAQISQWLVSLVADDVLKAGDKLPKEQDLAAALGVSRMTLRQSLGSLESRGMVERIPGRSGGTFISEPKIDVDITGLAGFTEQLRRGQVRATARVVSASVVAASQGVATALQLRRAQDVYEIMRIRRGRRRPLVLERSFLPVALFPGLLEQRLTGSLYALMRREYDQAPASATEYLEPLIATAEVASMLDVEEGSALLLIERTALAASGQPVEFARDIFRSDRLRISVQTVASP